MFKSESFPGSTFTGFVWLIFCSLNGYGSSTAQPETKITEVNRVEFIENVGQVTDLSDNQRPDVLFSASTKNYDVYLRKEGMSYVVKKYDEHKESSDIKKVTQKLSAYKPITFFYHRIDLDFLGSNDKINVVPTQSTDGYYNYYSPVHPDGFTNVKAYNNVTYKNVYQNIDVAFYSSKAEGLKYDIIVNPGGNIKNIRLGYRGTDNIVLENERLTIGTSLGNIGEWMPRIYQNINGTIKDIKGEYCLTGKEISFKIENYDKNFALIIDPWITYYGGNGFDNSQAIDVDNQGNIVITGLSDNGFPVSPGAYQSISGGWGDAFIVKFNPNGTRLWSTFYGGNDTDFPFDVVADNSDDIVITGATYSSNLPMAGSTFQNTFSGPAFVEDVFVAKFTSGGLLSWSTYYGGTDMDMAFGVTADNSNNIVITGFTGSAGFPVSVGAHQNALNASAGSNAFIVKFNTNGVRQWATYYGGAAGGDGMSVATDNISGDILITGTGFLAVKFNSAGNFLWQANVPGFGSGSGIATDKLSNVVITGGSPGYVVKLTGAGNFSWSRSFGNGACHTMGIITDANNNIYTTGDVYGNNIAATNCAHQKINGGGTTPDNEDNYIIRLDPNGNIVCSTYLGGNKHEEMDFGGTIAEYNGDVYITGQTPGNYPVTSNAYQTQFGGGIDAFIARICGNTCGDNTLALNFSASQTNVCVGTSINFSDLSSVCDTSLRKWNWHFPGATPSVSTLQNPSGITYNSKGSYPVKLIISTPCGMDSLLLNSYIHVDAPDIANINMTDVLCHGGNSGSASINVTNGTAPYTVLWSPSAGTGNTITGLPVGTYTATITDANSCSIDTTINITQPQPLIITATKDDISCFNGNNGSVSITPAGGVGGYKYQWTPGGQTTSGISNLIAGTYTVNISDNNGCSKDTSITLTSPGQVIAAPLTNYTICANQTISVQAQAFGGTGTYSYSWSPTNYVGNPLIINPTSTSAYTVVATDGNNCMATPQTFTVTVGFTPITLLASPDVSICEKDSTLLTVNPAGGSGAYNYSWSPVNNNTSSVKVGPLSTSTYTVIVSDNCGSTPDTSNITITVMPLPEVSLSISDTNGCVPLCVNFSNTTSNTQNVFWNFGNGNTSTAGNTSKCYQNPGTYSFSLTVTDNSGCSNTFIQSNKINAYPIPVASFTASKTITTLTDPLIQFTNQSVGSTAWLWSFGEVGSSTLTQQHPQYTYTDAGVYRVQLIVSNEYGCSDTTEQSIEVQADHLVYLPNTFTPNGDGLNDTFKPKLTAIAEDGYKMYIFDRWGELIFESDNVLIGWDGKANNGEKLAQIDTYVWKISAISIYGKKISMIGHVNLIK